MECKFTCHHPLKQLIDVHAMPHASLPHHPLSGPQSTRRTCRTSHVSSAWFLHRLFGFRRAATHPDTVLYLCTACCVAQLYSCTPREHTALLYCRPVRFAPGAGREHSQEEKRKRMEDGRAEARSLEVSDTAEGQKDRSEECWPRRRAQKSASLAAQCDERIHDGGVCARRGVTWVRLGCLFNIPY